MSLPLNVTPTYTFDIPSLNKTIKFRPFVVKDEKALLIAQQSEQPSVMLDTVRDVIKSCAKEPLDVESLASFDVEYLFLKLRSVSVGEIVEMIFPCDVCPPTDENARALVPINLETITVERFEGHENPILLFDNVGVRMKYPTVATLKKIDQADDDTDLLIDIVIDCIDYIYDDEQMFPVRDQKRSDVVMFLENLTSPQFERIRTFFRTLPQLRVYVDYSCPVCGTKHNKYMEGLTSFF